jgi:hypothetical protein
MGLFDIGPNDKRAKKKRRAPVKVGPSSTPNLSKSKKKSKKMSADYNPQDKYNDIESLRSNGSKLFSNQDAMNMTATSIQSVMKYKK